MPSQTAAFDRVLAHAVVLAKQRSADAVEPVDLFAALLADESRAAEMFVQFGVHLDDPETVRLSGTSAMNHEPDLLTPAPVESEAFLAAIDVARREVHSPAGQASWEPSISLWDWPK